MSWASPGGAGGVEYSYGGSLFPQPGHQAWLRASTGICDGRIKECTMRKRGQADNPHPGRETLVSTALRDAADMNSERSNQAKHLRSSQCSDTQEVHFIAKKTKPQPYYFQGQTQVFLSVLRQQSQAVAKACSLYPAAMKVLRTAQSTSARTDEGACCV